MLHLDLTASDAVILQQSTEIIQYVENYSDETAKFVAENEGVIVPLGETIRRFHHEIFVANVDGQGATTLSEEGLEAKISILRNCCRTINIIAGDDDLEMVMAFVRKHGDLFIPVFFKLTLESVLPKGANKGVTDLNVDVPNFGLSFFVNIAFIDQLKVELVMKYQITPVFMKFLLDKPGEEAKRQSAAMGVGNLAKMSTMEVREKIMSYNVVPLLLKYFDENMWIRNALVSLSYSPDSQILDCKSLIDLGVATVCHDFLEKNPDDCAAILLLSCLTGKDEASKHKVSEAGLRKVSTCVIKVLAGQSKDESCTALQPVLVEAVKKDSLYCSVTKILIPLEILVINSSNQAVLATPELIATLHSSLLLPVMRSNPDGNKSRLLRILAQLVFVKATQVCFAENKMMAQTIQSIYDNEDGENHALASGILFTLKETQQKNSLTSPSPSPAPSSSLSLASPSTSDKIKVMISYNWKYQRSMIALKAHLTEHYSVWMDIDNMTGDIMEAMAKAVDSVDFVLSIISREYHDSSNCRRELQYATRKKKQIIYVHWDRLYVPDGWLGLMMGDSLYIDAREMSDDIPSINQNIVNQISIRLAANNNSNNNSNNNTSGDKKLPDSASSSPVATNNKGSMLNLDYNPSNDIGKTLKAILQQMEQMNEKFTKLEARVAGMEAKIDNLSIGDPDGNVSSPDLHNNTNNGNGIGKSSKNGKKGWFSLKTKQ